MNIHILAAEGGMVGNPVANIGIFLLFVAVTLFIVIRASKKNATAAEFFTAGRSFTGPQNGIAISGDYLSAASFLGIAGAIAVYGYDGFLYSIGFLVAWLVALLLVAELLRNAGKFTMADVLSFRLKQRPVRLAAALTTLTVCLFYLLAQMAGAGGLVALLLNVTSDIGQALVIAVVGLLMILYVLIGGMTGTTWVQIIKAVLLIGGAAMMTVWVLAKFGLNFSEMLGAAQSAVSGSSTEAVAKRDVLAPGAQYGANLTSQINFVSLALALVLGTAGLPHVLMRFYTVPTAKEARRSVVWAIMLIGAFYLFTLALGYGAAALVGPDKILAAPGAQNSAAPLLAFELGGSPIRLAPGTTLSAPPGTLHGLRNDTGSPVTVRVSATPGNLAERGLRAYFGLCRDGLVSQAGMPKNPFVGAIILNETGTYFPPLPVWLSRVLFAALAAIGRRMGGEKVLAHYLEPPSQPSG